MCKTPQIWVGASYPANYDDQVLHRIHKCENAHELFSDKGRTIRKAMGGGFRLHEFFFFFHSLIVQEFFFSGATLCTNFFFQTNIAFLLNSEILIHYLCFCALQIIILCTQDRSKDISHF